MAEDALLGFEGFVFARLQVRGVDLLVLIAPQIDHAQAVLLALEQIVELVWSAAPTGVGFGDSVGGNAAEAVQEDALLRLVEARQASRSARGPEPAPARAACSTATVAGWLLTKTRPLPVDRISRRRMMSLPLGVDAVFLEDGFGAGRGLKDAGDNGLVGAVAHHFDGGLAAHQQGQRVNQDGFARAGFAGKQVEPGAEGGDGVIDDGVVFSAQFDEHGWFWSEHA